MVLNRRKCFTMVSSVYNEHELGIFPKHRRPSSVVEDVISDLKSQKYFVETCQEDEQIPNPEVPHSHYGRVNEAFNAMRYAGLVLGRFPFRPTFQIDPCNNLVSKKGKNYSPSIKSFAWFYFGITSLFLVILLLFSIGSFLGVFLSWSFLNFTKWNKEQTALFQANLIPFVLVWSCLLSATVGNISFFLNRKTVCKFLNYWNVAVDTMDVEVPRYLGRFLHMNNLWFVVFSIIIIVSTHILGVELARGGSTLMGVLVLRVVAPNIDIEEGDMWISRTFGTVIILYAIYASRAMLFFFVFKCKLLRHCIKIYNTRLRNELNQSRSQSTQQRNEETRCKKLFADHALLLKLVRLTDKVFAAILLSYFGSQILNMCFELYYVAMSNSTTIFTQDGDGMDTFVAILLLIQNIYVFLSVSLHAAYVAEEANKGFEIVKTKGISVHDSLARRHLILSLQISFQQRINITGGHYFVVDKPFIVTVLGSVFTYFIIIIQYGYNSSPECRNNSTNNASGSVIM